MKLSLSAALGVLLVITAVDVCACPDLQGTYDCDGEKLIISQTAGEGSTSYGFGTGNSADVYTVDGSYFHNQSGIDGRYPAHNSCGGNSFTSSINILNLGYPEHSSVKYERVAHDKLRISHSVWPTQGQNSAKICTKVP